ncbi:MAG: 4Fe-4S binding protein [Promethearchaeota archaeon]|nr:MAG: 4Fe-4S binding protein [Candidatus Lokiarchaeota archaeon]
MFMINQNNTTQLNMITALPMFIFWIVISALAIVLIYKQKITKKKSIIIYLISIIIGGIILGGIPNVVMPIQQILSALGGNAIITSLIPMIIVLIILLLTTLVFGRIFCGYACPVGAVQELISKIKFKSSIKGQKNIKFKIDISEKTARIIRWSFFAVVILIIVVWNIALLQLLNPFVGYSFFRDPLAMVLLIPLISLISVMVLSIFIYRPWCRLLCPFGALAGFTSRFSKLKYCRTEACTDCGLCEKICPTQESYKNSSKGECYYCNRCVDICPVDAIKLQKK